MLGVMGEPLSQPNIDEPHAQAQKVVRSYVGPQLFARRALSIGLFLTALLSSLLLARIGTLGARWGAISAMALGLVGLNLWSRRVRRSESDVQSTLRRVIRPIDPELGERAGRAVRLYLSSVERGESTEHSHELAALHASRVLAQIRLEEVVEAAGRARRRKTRPAWTLIVGALLVVLFWGLRFFEGLDVLLARGGVGPFAVEYVKELEVTAEWPAYLDGTGQRRRLFTELSAVPQGSEVEVRVTPAVAGRRLFLTDGEKKVPLVSDGQGNLIARWVADEATALKVAARFGEVMLYDVHQTQLEPMEDRAPRVTLADAPQTLTLAELERLELTFVAHDDHGLSQVDLVLASGQRHARSELVRLDGQTRLYRGGTALTREHELLRRAFLPVHVRIEARDGNTATGPSWGKSPEIILLPEPLGQAVAERHLALRAFRKQLSAYVAAEHEAGYENRETQKARLEKAEEQLKKALSELNDRLSGDPSAPKRSIAFVAAQVEALGRAGNQRADATSVLLATDALIGGLARREAKALAKDLGQSVEEIAIQARQLRFDPASLSLDGLFDLVAGSRAGAEQLYEVGVLGLDLGSVALADLKRIEKNIKDRAFDRAEAAALHLAERLKRATPSFSSTGGGGAGVESGSPSSGQGQGQPGSGQPASDAPSEFDQLAEQLNQLAADGASELNELERLLEEAQEALRSDFETPQELKDALGELEDALSELPQVGRGTGSASSEAASARSQGEAMLEALQGRELREAVERGLDAQQALKRARALLERGFGFMDGSRVERAEQAVKKAVEEAGRALEQQESAAARLDPQRSRERSERQRELADRARQIRDRGKNPGSALPAEKLAHLDQASRLLDQAAQALEAGQTEQSRDLAEQAQGHMERASFELQEGDSEEHGGEPGDGNQMNFDGEVPDEDKDRARDFRQRIEEGLGRGSGRLAPAVRRYAEELK